MVDYKLVFDEIILKQLKNAAKNKNIKSHLIKMLDKIELLGPLAGKLIDNKLSLYEIKSIRPPIRLYYRHIKKSTIEVFEFEMKTNPKKQNKTIKKLKDKIKSLNLF